MSTGSIGHSKIRSGKKILFLEILIFKLVFHFIGILKSEVLESENSMESMPWNLVSDCCFLPNSRKTPVTANVRKRSDSPVIFLNSEHF